MAPAMRDIAPISTISQEKMMALSKPSAADITITPTNGKPCTINGMRPVSALNSTF
jgi:hypothetical protein